MTMDAAYIAPTNTDTSSTQMPATTTQTTKTSVQPTIASTKAVETSKVTQIVHDVKSTTIPETEIEQEVNADGAFHVSWMIWTISACVLCWGFCCVIFAIKKKRKQKKGAVDFKGVGNCVAYGIADNPDEDDVNLTMVQMNNFAYGAGTIGSATGTGTKGKGEIIAMNDSDASSEDEDVVSHAVIDGTEGNHDVTLNDDDDAGQFLDDDDSDENNELYTVPTKKGGHQKKKSWVKF